ncbi:MAG: retropepsin-like aspartic protease [Planctomycetota bacterium]
MDAVIQDAWAAWTKGDVLQAETLAMQASETSAGRHLLFLCALVKGEYERALELHQSIEPSYARRAELDDPVVQAYLHLSRYSGAETFARARGKDRTLCSFLAARAEDALAVTLEDMTEIPFADHPLSDYLPGFEAEVNGTQVVAHLDTGGTFLHMGPDRAKALGIDLGFRGEAAYHGGQTVQSYEGIARTFSVGEALLENVPVVALASLVEQWDFIIFGTNILEQFLSTIDYRSERLILSPRGDPELRKRHLALLGTQAIEVPFFLWGTHYMFARGRVGDRDDLNFFVDSGLVSLHPDGKGGVRQAAFWAAQADLEAWGLDPELVRKGVFESPVTLSLGPLQQRGLLFLAQGRPPVTSLGGVRIDGLLSHAFLRNTTWTLDFEKHRYLFQSRQ